jgi:carboxypeptidase PM20D1
MSKFIARVSEGGIFRPEFAPEVKATFTRHAPYMAFPLRTVFGNFRLFAPLIKKIMAGIPQAAAMLTTGVTFTSFHAGEESTPHLKAKRAEATMYLRCVREETLEKELERIRAVAADCGVEIEQTFRDYCEPSRFDTRPFAVLEQLLQENFPDVIVAPFLLTAGTDARRFTGLADSILRFAPIDLSKQQFASIHNRNENITVQNIGQCVLFYKDFIRRI